MCIRDSPSPLRGVYDSNNNFVTCKDASVSLKDKLNLDTQSGGKTWHYYAPVSYTHLLAGNICKRAYISLPAGHGNAYWVPPASLKLLWEDTVTSVSYTHLVQGTVPYLLINACSISFDQLWRLVRERNGVMFPAHVEKPANSLIANLGFVPPDSEFKTAELKNLKKLHEMRREHPYLEQCRIISNSDAHYLEDINEPLLTIDVKEKSAEAVIWALL